MRTFVGALALALLTTGVPIVAATAAENQPPGQVPEAGFVAGEILVKFDNAVSSDIRHDLHRSLGSHRLRRLPLPGWELVRLPRGATVAQGVAAYEARPEVTLAEPNYLYQLRATPNDPSLGELWGLHNVGQSVAGVSGTADADIDAPEAWDISRGDASVAVAVVDSGVDYQHPELSGRIWTNPGETGAGKETDLLDNDFNLYFDDWRGWDWVDDDNAPQDPVGHGTHVAGVIGAAGNNAQAITGVNWDVRIMPLRVLDSNGMGTGADVASAFRYAADKGARIVNASFGGPNISQAVRDAIKTSSNTLFVFAAGNGNQDGIGDNNDATPDYPCALTEPNIVCVAATNQSDALAGFSNYGPSSVDLAAPGTTILSTVPGGFLYASGTSMSAPFVAGVAALGWASTPSAGQTTIKDALLNGVDPKPSLSGKLVTGGRLNAFNTLSLLTTGKMPTPSSTPTSTPTPTPTPQPSTTSSPSPSPSPSPQESPTPTPSPSAPSSPSPQASPSAQPTATDASPSPTAGSEATPSPQPTADPNPDSRNSRTSLAVDIRKTRLALHFSGSVSPAQPDGVVAVKLLRRKGGNFVTVARKVRPLGAAWDSNLDGTPESLYEGRFRRPAAGRCQLRVRFPGDANHPSITKRKFFRC